jgi:hypothetical protein
VPSILLTWESTSKMALAWPRGQFEQCAVPPSTPFRSCTILRSVFTHHQTRGGLRSPVGEMKGSACSSDLTSRSDGAKDYSLTSGDGIGGGCV